VAGRPQRFLCARFPQPLRRPREHSDNDFGHGREYLRRVHSGRVGIAHQELLDGRRKSEEFPFHAEESAQRPGAEICVEDRKEERSNLLSPDFWDIYVYWNCNENSHSYTRYFGTSYTNGAGLDRKTFLMGLERFKMKKFQAFKITD
jgi:hypothetical protein